jgi:hypothetical protein
VREALAGVRLELLDVGCVVTSTVDLMIGSAAATVAGGTVAAER